MASVLRSLSPIMGHPLDAVSIKLRTVRVNLRVARKNHAQTRL